MATGAHRDFASLLDEILSEETGLREAPARPASLDYLSVAEELHSGRINFTDQRAQAEYRAHQGARAEKIEEPAPLPSTDPDEIARELGLSARQMPKNLDRLRRDFAFRNHPDRVPAHLRANAMIRMQVANMLIDEAKRGRLRRRRGGEARA